MSKNMIEQWMHSLFAASFCSSLFIFIFIVFRKVIVRYVGSTCIYYMWFSVFIPWVAVLVPTYFFWDLGLFFNPFFILKPIVLLELRHKPFFSQLYIFLTNGPAHSYLIIKSLFIAWIVGVIISLSYILFRHLQFVAELKKKSRRLTKEECKEIKNILSEKEYKYISKMYLSIAILSPMVCHILKQKIYLPEQFFKIFTTEEKKYILRHELLHLRRYDLLANAFMLFIGCINWFNPIMIYSYRSFRVTQELSCDAKVCKLFSNSEKKAYGFALLKTVTHSNLQDSKISCWWNTGIALIERCQMLSINQTIPLKIWIGTFILCFTMFLTLAMVNLQNRDVLFIYSVLSNKGADFIIKIFNNTNLQEPLHYSIQSDGQRLADGKLYNGDNYGQFITVNGFPHTIKSAEIIVDQKGFVIWRELVVLTNLKSEIYAKTVTLKTGYELRTNMFSDIHAFSFDIVKSI